MIQGIPTAYDRGKQCNAQGYNASWNGCKLHLDTAGCGVPIAAVLSSASMHDSLSAIALSLIGAHVSALPPYLKGFAEMLQGLYFFECAKDGDETGAGILARARLELVPKCFEAEGILYEPWIGRESLPSVAR